VKLWGETVSGGLTDLLHNMSILNHVTRLPFNHYALIQDTLHVCYVYPTAAQSSFPVRKLVLSDGSTAVGYLPCPLLLQGLPRDKLFRDPCVEYGSAQATRRREIDGSLVRHVLNTAVPMNVVPADPEWEKIKALYGMTQTMVKALRKSSAGLQIYGLTEIDVPCDHNYIVAERGNVRALVTSLGRDGTAYLNIEIRVAFFTMATAARVVPFDGKVVHDQYRMP